MKVFLKGTIIGAIIAYVWMMISWMVIPWHQATYDSFKNEKAVTAAIMRNVSDSGIYVLPSKMEIDQETEEALNGTPTTKEGRLFMFSAINKNFGPTMSPMTFVYAFITQLILAFLITWLTKAAAFSRYFGRLLFIVGVALTGSLMIYLPFLTWWSFSTSFVFVGIVDMVVTWFLAGLAIAAFTKRPTQIVGLQ